MLKMGKKRLMCLLKKRCEREKGLGLDVFCWPIIIDYQKSSTPHQTGALESFDTFSCRSQLCQRQLASLPLGFVNLVQLTNLSKLDTHLDFFLPHHPFYRTRIFFILVYRGDLLSVGPFVIQGRFSNVSDERDSY